MTLLALVSVRLTRLPRGRCAACSRRRVLFTQRVEIAGGTGYSDSSHLCAECAGFAKGNEPRSVDDAIAEPILREDVEDHHSGVVPEGRIVV